MTQSFKTIYFADYPREASNRRNVTLAFGPSDADLYQTLKPLSGQELRELIGHSSYRSLQRAALGDGLALNTFCLRVLRRRIGHGGPRAVQRGLPDLDEDLHLPFDPVQATFRGGKAEPLHEWYPYLEGYSPEFVTRVLQDFAPKARCVLDPFAGSGTTPLTTAQEGLASLYCEVNPLLQFLVAAKVLAAAMPGRDRLAMSLALEDLARRLSHLVKGSRPDASLACAYRQAFGESRFFTEETLDQILRLRSLLDDLDCGDPNLARLSTVAVLASLVPASLLIRRGDLRYKTKEELKRPCEGLLPTLKVRLLSMASDLLRLRPLHSQPCLICEDARNLGIVPRLDVGAVITSPPYLNGTNYFRNTKIELWFLRCLASEEDLACFRSRAVTAGINDVTVGKPSDIDSEAVADVVRRLSESAYDPRIPLMVKCYFHDMSVAFDGLAAHMRKKVPLVVDIGDSVYGGVHVPTHELLSGLLQEKGFDLDRQLTLRKRMSRSGIPLSQTLLVLHKRFAGPSRRSTVQNPYQVVWYANWRRFKQGMPHQHAPYAKRNWGHPLHSLCSYQGKMKPSLAHFLVRTFVPPAGKMLDPFGGVGTIAFEAALHGIRAWSFDISPAAVHIAKAKLHPADAAETEGAINSLEAFIRSNRPTVSEQEELREIRINGPLADYFNPKTLEEILLARRFFMRHPASTAAESLVLASLLHILHGNRPYALSRRSHPITPFSPTGAAEYRALIPRLREKVRRSLEAELPAEFMRGQSLYQDATAWWPQEIADLDAVITSPPFYDSTRFYMANWMRLWFAGWTATDFTQRPRAFVDERQKKGFGVYEPVIRQARERLKPGGVMVLHLGKSGKCDMAESLKAVARKWFNVVDLFTESVRHCESHGIRDKGTVVEHTYLVLN